MLKVVVAWAVVATVPLFVGLVVVLVIAKAMR